MPITTKRGGTSAVSNVILYPNKYIMPTLHITLTITTHKDNNVVCNDRNNNNKINAESASEPMINHFISCAILSATWVRISGKPLMCV